MNKINNLKEINKLNAIIPKEIQSIIKNIMTILDTNYGQQRSVDDDGGYILVIQNKEDISTLSNKYLDIEDLLPEYVDRVICSNGEIWINALILMNNEFGITLLMPIDIAPKTLLDEIN